MRTFAAVVDTGQFQAAGDELAMTEQAGLQERSAALKASVARPSSCASRKACASASTGGLLPHAPQSCSRDRAIASVLPSRRALRVDVLNRRIGRTAAGLPPAAPASTWTTSWRPSFRSATTRWPPCQRSRGTHLPCARGKAAPGRISAPGLFCTTAISSSSGRSIRSPTRRQLTPRVSVDHRIWMFPHAAPTQSPAPSTVS